MITPPWWLCRWHRIGFQLFLWPVEEAKRRMNSCHRCSRRFWGDDRRYADELGFRLSRPTWPL